MAAFSMHFKNIVTIFCERHVAWFLCLHKSGKTKCARFEKRNVQKSGKTKRSKKFAHTTL